jgi:oligosaccharyltransferase complex subunit delta (ribophorin II)
LVTDPATGASLSYVAKVRPNGSAKVTISNSNFPGALRDTPLAISAIVGSFGDDNPTTVDVASNVIVGRTSEYMKPARFEMLPEIKHVFRTKPHTVNPVIALAFAGGAVFLLLTTLAVFASNGVANLSKALSTSPIGHLGLVSSLVAYEAVFLLYYLGNSIFTTLGAAAVITPIAVYTGSRALREVGARRRSGQFR